MDVIVETLQSIATTDWSCERLTETVPAGPQEDQVEGILDLVDATILPRSIEITSALGDRLVMLVSLGQIISVETEQLQSLSSLALLWAFEDLASAGEDIQVVSMPLPYTSVAGKTGVLPDQIRDESNPDPVVIDLDEAEEDEEDVI